MTVSAAAGLALLDVAVAEVTLFAATAIAIGGIDDLLLDLLWRARRTPATPIDLLPQAPPLRLAIFVPAWDEHRVIAAMLSAALRRYVHPDYRLYVGCYPNDPATIAAVATVASHDRRVRLVIGTADGPTTKAGCLNTLWHAMQRADVADARRTDAIVLHDAEDVVHPDELRVFDHHLREAALVQLPVVPLIDPRRRLVSGTYADEFSESHGRHLVVRAALGAALPLAGVGCAIRRDALDALAGPANAPFDAQSLTEDYELGLRVGALGLTAQFARWRDGNGALVATLAYFPDTIDTAVKQKARWVTGIALAGWDRTGWGGRWRWAELWMRMRDRRGPLAVLALLAAYAALLGFGASLAGHAVFGGGVPAAAPAMRLLLMANAALLGWRLAVRARATAEEHGWREGLWSIPRALVGNIIAMLAARRALTGYVATLRGAPLRWDKTGHRFPDILPGDA